MFPARGVTSTACSKARQQIAAHAINRMTLITGNSARTVRRVTKPRAGTMLRLTTTNRSSRSPVRMQLWLVPNAIPVDSSRDWVRLALPAIRTPASMRGPLGRIARNATPQRRGARHNSTALIPASGKKAVSIMKAQPAAIVTRIPWRAIHACYATIAIIRRGINTGCRRWPRLARSTLRPRALGTAEINDLGPVSAWSNTLFVYRESAAQRRLRLC